MHVIAIENAKTAAELHIIDEMHRLRARIFQGRLAWTVRCVNGREYDQFDDLSPTYIIALATNTMSLAALGCFRRRDQQC